MGGEFDLCLQRHHGCGQLFVCLLQVCVNAQVGIEVVLGRQIKNAVFSELSEIEAESLPRRRHADAIDVIFAIAFIGGISLNFVTLSTLTVLFFLKVFHYMCDFRQESGLFPPQSTPPFYISSLCFHPFVVFVPQCARNKTKLNRCNKTSTLMQE